MGKKISLIANGRTYDLKIAPETTAADVLAQVVLLADDFCLSPRAGLPFERDELVYERVRDGEKLYASPQAGGLEPSQ
jgi:hypothetical protein